MEEFLNVKIQKIENGLLVTTEYSWDISDKLNVKDTTFYAMDMVHALEILSDRVEELAEKIDEGVEPELPF